MTNEANLTLKDGYVDVKIKNGAVNSNKTISYEELGSIFEKTGNISSPYLPGEFGLQKYMINGNREYYLYIEQPKIVTCKYDINNSNYEPDPDDFDDDDDYQEALDQWRDASSSSGSNGMNVNQFTAPIMAFFVALTKHSNGQYAVNDTYLFALKTPIYTGKEALFHVPFSNVYEEGRICWGNNAVSIPTLKAIQGLSTLFFAAPFNTDLDSHRFNHFQRSYLEGRTSYTLHFQMEVNAMLKDSKKTPDEVLSFVQSKMISANMSVDEFFKSFSRRH